MRVFHELNFPFVMLDQMLSRYKIHKGDEKLINARNEELRKLRDTINKKGIAIVIEGLLAEYKQQKIFVAALWQKAAELVSLKFITIEQSELGNDGIPVFNMPVLRRTPNGRIPAILYALQNQHKTKSEKVALW